jgi:hypothetical protein
MEKELADAKRLLSSIPESVNAKVSSMELPLNNKNLSKNNQEDRVKQVTILKGVSLKATGFTHKFTPTVPLLDAALWYFLLCGFFFLI